MTALLSAATLEIGAVTLQKMALIFNAVEAGWSVKKHGENYIFSKKHNGETAVYYDTYLQTFIETHSDLSRLAREVTGDLAPNAI